MVQPIERLALLCFLCLIVFQCLYALDILFAILLIYFWMLRVSFKIVVFTLIKPHPPSFGLVYSLCVLDLEWKFPCIVRSFLVFTSVASVSSSVHLAMPSAYLMTDSTYDMAFVLPTGLIFQNLFYALVMLKNCILIMITMWLWDSKVLVVGMSSICPDGMFISH